MKIPTGIARGVVALIAWTCAMIVPAYAETNTMWFPVGEKLTYRLYWGIVPVGTAWIGSSWIREEGKPDRISITMRGKTGRIVSALYPVEDFVESIVDAKTFLPIRYTQRLREGKKKRDDVVEFDHAAGKAHWSSESDGKSKDIDIEAETRDVLSFVYYMRSRGIDVGKTEKFQVIVDEDLYELSVTGLGHEKVYMSAFGDVRCLKLEPKAKFGEVFVRQGRLNMWFSADDRKICAKADAEVPLASVKAILRKVEGPGNDLWIKKSK
ncbi:MAG: DUF3108 domain-containing protein [Lentisphaerales bacterium]|nr:MAG: DUF3108 domain-containing protein [Lentisphaerales bacterium]